MNLLELVVLFLAVWRVSRLLSDDTEAGPFGIMHKFRYWVGVRYDDNSRPYGLNELANAVICIKCCSIWIGLFMSAMWMVHPQYVSLMYLPLAASGAVLYFEGA